MIRCDISLPFSRTCPHTTESWMSQENEEWATWKVSKSFFLNVSTASPWMCVDNVNLISSTRRLLQFPLMVVSYRLWWEINGVTIWWRQFSSHCCYKMWQLLTLNGKLRERMWQCAILCSNFTQLLYQARTTNNCQNKLNDYHSFSWLVQQRTQNTTICG